MKKLLTICAITAACGTTFAQSSVQLMGTVDTYLGSMRVGGDAARKTVVNSGGMTTSWFGFKGSEDLGGGLKANFGLTSFIQVDSGAQGRFTGDTFFSRDANVGLSGGFGSFSLGRGLAPNFLPTVIFNPFGDSFTFAPLVLHANVPLFNGTGWTATTPADTGWSNALIYSTPNLSGFSANVHYQFGEQANDNGKKNIGFNAMYFAGPLALTGFYEAAQIGNPALPNAPLAATKKDWMLGGSYDMTVAKAYLTHGQAKAENSAAKTSTTSVGVGVPMGAGKVLAGLARTTVSGANTRTTSTVGYDYNFSKSTDMYAMLMNDKITNFNTGNSVAVGIRKKF
ncbi:MAG: porin [Burkholderiaceae bacterium]|nr:porin [Burkholderiaceae bacterium]